MKKTLLAILLFSGVGVNAQFTTGQKLLGAQFNVGINNSKSLPAGSSGSNSIYTGLFIQKFFTPTLLKGFGVNYSYSNNRNNGNTINYRNNFGASFGITKLQPLAKEFYFTFGGSAFAGYQNGRDGVISANYTNIHGFNAGVTGTLGLLYKLTQRIVLTGQLNNILTLQYNNMKFDGYSGATAGGGSTLTNSVTSNNVSLNSGLRNFGLDDFSIGVSYLIRK